MKHDIIDLEKEIALVEMDAVVEEQYNADDNYKALDKEKNDIKDGMPFPDIDPFAVGIDYDDIDRVQYAKKMNAPYYKLLEKISPYCNDGSLYSGHLELGNNDYYIMDHHNLPSKTIVVNGKSVFLINADDRYNSKYVRWWRYPSDNTGIKFSRSITMQRRKVFDVDVIMDSGNEMFSNISDAYLRKALIRNKDKSGVQSIIQTIQKKQDNIRSLDKNESFIVQGCAGSGKTMVLLHRLRYLLFNKDIYDDEYLFLIPGNQFKEFISGASSNFNIRRKNIFCYQEYYQDYLGKQAKMDNANELVFSPEYLNKVYSKEFIQQAYSTLFDMLSKQANSLIIFCEGKFNERIDFEKLIIEDEIDTVKKESVANVEKIIKGIQGYINTKVDALYDNISKVICEIEEIYTQKKSEYDAALNMDISITVSPDDERLRQNENLLRVKESIDAEKETISKASIFTVLSHKNKLKKLQTQYDSVYNEIIQSIIEEEKKKYNEKLEEHKFVFGNISLAKVEEILNELKDLLFKTDSKLLENQSKLENINEHLGKKFENEINKINEFIEISSEIIDKNNYVSNLISAHDYFYKTLKIGEELINIFETDTSNKEKEYLKTKIAIFSPKTDKQIYAYFNTVLFNICAKNIYNEFNVKICDAYKHYWYLSLYCSYLTKPNKEEVAKYLFIDEAQDLSVSEIELIEKINMTSSNKPVMNLFGDTNQTITLHGITDWKDLKSLSQVYLLEENFRNTNQIVEYCNRNLMMNMLKVGVDMDSVDEYATLDNAMKLSNNIFNDPIFIVKNDYIKKDLEDLLVKTKIQNYDIHTVKSVKGLEFKEVFVVDEKMTNNEKYISYTRALVKLNIIKSIPQTANREISLILQGADTEDSAL